GRWRDVRRRRENSARGRPLRDLDRQVEPRMRLTEGGGRTQAVEPRLVRPVPKPPELCRREKESNCANLPRKPAWLRRRSPPPSETPAHPCRHTCAPALLLRARESHEALVEARSTA